MNFKKYHESKNLFDVSTVEKGRIDNGEVGYVSQTSSLTIEGGTVSFTTTVTYRGVCSGFFEIPEGTETITFNFIRNEALGVKFVFYDNAKTWLNQDYAPTLQDIPPATANVPSGAKYVRLSFTGQITGGYSYTMSNIMLNTGSTALPYEPYSLEVWHDTPHYIHNTSTDTLITLPVDIYANDTTATVGLKGQMEQSGTPTPSSPIQPQECGERTENLVNFNALLTSPTGYIEDVQFEHVLELTLKPNTTYTMSSTGSGGEGGAADTNRSLYFNKSGASNGCVYKWHPISQTTDSTGKVKIGFMSSRTNAQQYINGDAVIMLNTGSTALPYEPWGIKIPILSNSTTTNVYLGEVETTRQVKKVILTGEENWQLQSINSRGIANFWVFNYLAGINSDISALCTHFYQTTAPIADVTEPCFSISTTSASLYLRIQSTTASDATEFKAWLAQQYTAGTPVCVWYVLATPETAVVNEPIRKIGDYADTVSGITIPTTAGANTLSVDTTLQPSEVSVNYKGWHPVSAVHERESGAWT